ncbi:enolase C-terminal domain-like protein [Microlunatus sp. Y2014]|uniref:enolase C-terminal domain-like protein n=1 Tax=Microlunatus sp. Y2014 TaxID=3418488 RepID=UPI003DA75473
MTSEVQLVRERLGAPFGFKGRQVEELWQVVVRLAGDDHGIAGQGVGVQSPIWSDAAVADRHGIDGANEVMLAITRAAVELADAEPVAAPDAVLAAILPKLAERARELAGTPALRETFVLNALVPLDVALWQRWARRLGTTDPADVVPDETKAVLATEPHPVELMPAIAYGTDDAEIDRLADSSAVFKIKLGADPHGDGNPLARLAWDIGRMADLHEVVGDRPVQYYLDLNGQYDSLSEVRQLLEGIAAAGAGERVVLLEEPLDETNLADVSGLGVLVAADESAHGPDHLRQLADRGYGAVAFKPSGKTPSVTCAMIAEAHRLGLHGFVADLTATPLLVEWNTWFAARLPALPGLDVAVMESNGAQNYARWDELVDRLGEPTDLFTRTDHYLTDY